MLFQQLSISLIDL